MARGTHLGCPYSCLEEPIISEVVPKVGFEPTRPLGALRPERSASAVPPLRRFILYGCYTIFRARSMVGDTGLEPVTSCV